MQRQEHYQVLGTMWHSMKQCIQCNICRHTTSQFLPDQLPAIFYVSSCGMQHTEQPKIHIRHWGDSVDAETAASTSQKPASGEKRNKHSLAKLHQCIGE